MLFRSARRSKVGRNQYTFKLDWAFCRLEPGDLVRITDEASGITNQPVMITRVQEDEKGLLTFTAISWFTANYGRGQATITVTVTKTPPTGDMTGRYIMIGCAALVVLAAYLFITKRKEQE